MPRLNSVDELLHYEPSPALSAVEVLGYHLPYDGGGGIFHYNPKSNEATNLGTVFPGLRGGRWRREYAGSLNLPWFGAIADGPDCKQALQNALDTGEDIVIPAGTWYFNVSGKHRDYLRPVSNQSIEMNSNTILALSRPITNYIFWWIAPGISNVTLKGGWMIGYRESQESVHWSYGHGVVIHGGCQIRVEGTRFLNFSKSAVAIRFATNVTLQSITSMNCRQNGMSVTSGQNIQIYDSQFIGAHSPDTNDPMAGIDIEPNPGEQVDDLILARNVVACNGKHGIYLQPPFSRILVENNRLLNNAGSGLTALYGMGLWIRGNQCQGNGGAGIYLGGTSHLVLAENNLLDNGESGVLIQHGFYLSMRENTVARNGESGISCYYSSNAIFSANRISENRLRGIHASGSQEVQFTSNGLFLNGMEAVLFRHTSYSSILENIFYGNCQSNSLYTIELEAGSSYNQVSGNMKYGIAVSMAIPHSTARALVRQQSGTCLSNLITANEASFIAPEEAETMATHSVEMPASDWTTTGVLASAGSEISWPDGAQSEEAFEQTSLREILLMLQNWIGQYLSVVQESREY